MKKVLDVKVDKVFVRYSTVDSPRALTTLAQ